MPTSSQSIGEIISKHSTAAAILQRFDIDLCAQAGQPLERACAELQLSVDQVLEKLADAEIDEPGAAPADPATLSISRLIQHIVRIHHRRVRQQLPQLLEMSEVLAAKRGDRAPELNAVKTLLYGLRADLNAHIEKEEQILFPFISQMDQDSTVVYPPAHACFRSVTQPVFMMVQEHESAAHIVAELNRITNGFQPPAWACTTHTALFDGLKAFESDLKQHIHLENEVLFPRAIELETELNNRG